MFLPIVAFGCERTAGLSADSCFTATHFWFCIEVIKAKNDGQKYEMFLKMAKKVNITKPTNTNVKSGLTFKETECIYLKYHPG